ncbi:MAG: YraN family protein [Streptosporangiaceae bacterium]
MNDPGPDAKQRAAEYLKSCGLRILDRDRHGPEGEIDIVAEDRGTLVVCVVMSRVKSALEPLEAVSRARRARLRRLAVQWLNAHGVLFDRVRIDVIGLIYEGTGGFTIEHIKGVVVASDACPARARTAASGIHGFVDIWDN